MNIYKSVVVTFVTLIFYNGCAQHSVQKPKEKTELTLLNQKVKGLNREDKKLIYRSIQDEINIYSEKANEAYEAGYNRDAITAYELVNFYDGYATIPLKKIEQIKKTAKSKSKYHYKQALKYSQNNKKRAVLELNIVMKNNPDYKDSEKRLNLLKENREVKIVINTLKSSLKTKLLNNRGNITDLKAISLNLNELFKYDYKNETAIKAKKIVKKYHKVLVQNALEIYKKGDINSAQKRFNLILSIYKKDSTAKTYLKKIEIKKSKQLNLKLAQTSLAKKEYMASIKYAKKVLHIDSKNKKAKKIIAIANKESTKKVANLVDQGKQYYNDKNLDKAKQSFHLALSIDPHNNTSLIYAKRIDRQLKTIKSLQ